MTDANKQENDERLGKKFDLEKMLKEIEEDVQGALEQKQTVSQNDILNLLKKNQK
jgi:hypothetical protein